MSTFSRMLALREACRACSESVKRQGATFEIKDIRVVLMSPRERKKTDGGAAGCVGFFSQSARFFCPTPGQVWQRQIIPYSFWPRYEESRFYVTLAAMVLPVSIGGSGQF